MNRLLSIAALLLCSLLSFAFDFEVDGIGYNITSEKNLTLSVSVNGCIGDIVIPEKVTHEGETYTVTSIDGGVFYGRSGLTSITIPKDVTSIGDYAFYGCSGLTSITIPKDVTSIGDYAFSGCSGLTSIIVETGNTVYDSREHCNAIINTSDNTLIAGCKNSVIPSSVTSIGCRAFENCSGLTSVTIPSNVTSIGGGAFYYCI